MEITAIVVLAVAVAAVGFFIHRRSQSDLRSVDHFKTGLEKISPDSMPQVSSDPEDHDRTPDTS